MVIHIYLNEDSLVGQFHGENSEILSEPIGIITQLASYAGLEVDLRYTITLYSKIIDDITGKMFCQLNRTHRTLFQRMQYLLSKAHRWDSSPIQKKDITYFYQEKDIRDTSAAEATENKISLNNELSTLLNFPYSHYPHLSVIIERDGEDVKLHSIALSDQISEYINNLQIRSIYDPKSFNKVADEQTILVDEKIFRPTRYFNQGRRIYERLSANEYWCVDNFHRGENAHLEVFDKATLKFKGTCRIDDINAFTKKNENKHLNLK